ncbi:MAG TPA: PAS domain S-box protein [Rubricoccaceae bacterium]|jgi:PAS domain S-box-containing protein
MEPTPPAHPADDHYRLTSSLVWEAFDQAPAFIAVLRGPDHVFEYVNQAYLQLVGFRDVLGAPAREALPEVEGQGFFELLDRVYESGEPFVGTEVPISLQREPGAPPEERFVDFVYQPLLGPNGSVRGILAQGVDATDRVLAHRDLVEAHRDHDLVMDHSRDVLCLADAQGRFTRVSAASEAVFGYRPDELVGRPYIELVHPDDRALAAKVGAEIRAGTRVYSDLRHVRKDGTVVPVRWSSVWSEPDGVLLGVARDRTETDRQEAALRESEDRYRTLFTTIDEGYCLCEMVVDDGGRPVDYRFLEVNPAFSTMTGIAADAVGRTARELVPGLENHWVETYARAGLGRESFRFEQDSDAMGRSFDVYVSPVGEPGGRQFALVFMDVTARRRAEEEVRNLNEALEGRVAERTAEVRDLAGRLTVAEQEERDRIAQVLHDDLQQQLFGASVALSLVQRAPADGGDGVLVTKAATLVDTAVNMARTLAAELSPTILQAARLCDLLEGIASEKRRKYGLEVGTEVRGDPALPALAHRILLYQSVCEVLFNVVKHSGATAARLVAWQGGGEVVVRVEDDGAGFDVAAVAARAGGFGLPSVHERLRLVGGRFEVDSAPGAGTRVTLAVPAGWEAPPFP